MYNNINKLGGNMGKVIFFARYNRLDNYHSTDMPQFRLSTEDSDEESLEGDIKNELMNSYHECSFIYKDTIIIDEITFRRYSCTFTYSVTVEGFTSGSEFHSYQKKVRFFGYVPNESNFIFFGVKTDIGRKYIKSINSKSGVVYFESVIINFNHIEAFASRVVGVWIRFNNIEVSAKSLQGNDLINVPEYKRAKDLGTFSSLQIEYEFNGNILQPLISKKNSIFLIQNIDVETCLLLSYRIVCDLFR